MPEQSIDPRKIPCKDLPLIILVDDRNSFIGWGIKSHSKGCYNHVMTMYKPGIVASMDFAGYRERPIEDYLTRNVSLKFWRYDNATEAQHIRFILEIMKRLKEPWYKRRYDFLGIIGQLLNIRWIQNPFKRYCSEDEAIHIKKAYGLKSVPTRPSPAELNQYFKDHIGWSVYGRWWSEDD